MASQHEELQNARKSLIATFAVTIVFSFSRNSDVNWVISLTGVAAWSFLLCAHLYFFAMWSIYHEYRLTRWPMIMRQFFSFWGWKNVSHRRQNMQDGLTILVGLSGLAIIAYNLWLEIFSPTASTVSGL